MNRNTLAQVLTQLHEHIVRAPLLVYDLEFEAASKTLRLFIDKQEQGVSLEDCESTAKALENYLAAQSFWSDDYGLEVSSPGVERHLREDWHFASVVGQEIALKFFEPMGRWQAECPQALQRAKNLKVKLQAVDKENLVVEIANRSYVLPRQKVAKAHLVYEF